jgi:pimeloyl-ACP methyl ester carboxylesterase
MPASGNSSGETPGSFPEMGANAIAFIRALGLTQKVDVLGFSIGGFVAQEIALQAPDLVRKLILVGTGHARQRHVGEPVERDLLGHLRSSPSISGCRSTSRRPRRASAAGLRPSSRASCAARIAIAPVSAQTVAAQGEAIGRQIAPGERRSTI